MRFQGLGYRAHHPHWAWDALSGEGARLKGGRFNAKGVPALYLALSIEGMILEMSHGFAHCFDPLTICTYRLDVDTLIDLRHEAGRKIAGVDMAQLSCAWALDRANGRIPASWSVAETLIKQGAAGVLVPSFANGARESMCNLVLWKWSAELPHKVELHDPEGRLGQL